MTDTITILVFVANYIPGYKGGGPIRSIASLVELLGDEFNFKIITADHDLGVTEPFAGIIPNTWCQIGKAEVYYASNESLKIHSMAKLINTVGHDILYFNSFFSLDYSIKPLLLRYFKLISSVSTIMAPRGEFSAGALKLKSIKKKLYLFITHFFGIYGNIIWQASSEFEKTDIQSRYKYGKNKIERPIIVAPDLAIHKCDKSIHTPHMKKPGVLEIAFLSRISPKKNLDGALTMLNGIQGDITFNIFGPNEDPHYWHVCQNMCKSLKANIKVFFRGEVDPSRVNEIFQSHHLFFFPTHGENFGHVILESLLAGCPVLLSDQTPWRGLDRLGVGWDLPLDKPDKFREVLGHLVSMDQTEFNIISHNAEKYGKSKLEDSTVLEQNKYLFQYAFNNNK